MANKVIKGDCFKVAADYILDNCHIDSGLKLVHGLVTGQGKIEKLIYCHAWVETPYFDMVIDKSNGNRITVPRQFYYDLGKIKIVRKYTADQARRLLLDSEKYGPWDNVFNITWRCCGILLDVEEKCPVCSETYY